LSGERSFVLGLPVDSLALVEFLLPVPLVGHLIQFPVLVTVGSTPTISVSVSVTGTMAITRTEVAAANVNINIELGLGIRHAGEGHGSKRRWRRGRVRFSGSKWSCSTWSLLRSFALWVWVWAVHDRRYPLVAGAGKKVQKNLIIICCGAF